MMKVRRRSPPDLSKWKSKDELTENQEDAAICPHMSDNAGSSMELLGIPEHCLKALKEGKLIPQQHSVAVKDAQLLLK